MNEISDQHASHLVASHAHRDTGDARMNTSLSMAIRSRPDARYWISEHVHVCEAKAGVVVLDLRRNRYLGLSEVDTIALVDIVRDWPFGRNDRAPDAVVSSADVEELTNNLLKEGLITADPVLGKSLRQTVLEQNAMMDSVGHGDDSSANLRIGYIAAFLISCLHAKLALRCMPLESVVRRVTTKKAHGLETRRHQERSTAELVTIFGRMRSYVFTAKGNCLFHALALVIFLSRYNVYPLWVIGITTNPFGAHSWVQDGTCVLDATPEQVCFHTPILAI